MTQEKVAEALDVSPVTLSRWINGHADPSFDKLDRLASATGQAISLTFGTEQQESPPAWAEGLMDEDVPAIRRGVDELLEELAALRAALEANAAAGAPSDDDPVDDPSSAPHHSRRGR